MVKAKCAMLLIEMTFGEKQKLAVLIIDCQMMGPEGGINIAEVLGKISTRRGNCFY